LSALTPYENLSVVAFLATETAHNPTSKEMMSLSYEENRVSTGGCVRSQKISHHVEGISHERERVDSKPDTQLEQEEHEVDDEHHLDARRL
jgi:hypothetical protein